LLSKAHNATLYFPENSFKITGYAEEHIRGLWNPSLI